MEKNNMEKIFFIIIVIIAVNTDNLCFSQNYQWAKSIGSSNMDETKCITLDNKGNVYITGFFSDTIDFDPGIGIAYLSAVSNSDIFFAKYDNNGNYLWAKSIGNTNGVIYSFCTTVDSSYNVYITGSYTGTTDFDPGSGIINLTSVGYNDIFFAKYDNNGNYLWAKSIGGINNDGGYSIAIDYECNVYITGFFQNTSDFDPGLGTANLTALGSNDIFFAKYDNYGNYIWAKSIGSTDSDYSNCIVVDNLGNVYITGTFHGTADFDAGIGTVNITPVGLYDIFFTKYDNNGNYIWAKNIGSTDWDEGNSIAIDIFGNVYITGSFTFTADFDPSTGTANLTSVGMTDIYFAKYDNDGNYLWAKNIGSTNNDASKSIAIDYLGNVYITGYFHGTADFNPGSGTANITTANVYDVFFAKYNNDGNYLWAKNISSNSSSKSNSIVVNNYGDLFIAGFYTGTADFDPSSSTVNLTAVGSSDLFFAKYNDPTIGIEEINAFKKEKLDIYPNPASTKITISNNSKISKSFNISIINIQGEKIADNNYPNKNSIEIDVSKLTKGIYLVRIQTENSVEIKKLVIQ